MITFVSDQDYNDDYFQSQYLTSWSCAINTIFVS